MSWYHAEVLVASHKFDDAMKVYMDVRNQAGTDDQRTSVVKTLNCKYRTRRLSITNIIMTDVIFVMIVMIYW